MRNAYVITATAALVSATAKTAANLITGSGTPPTICGIDVSFDGADATKTPVLIELCSSTQATAGTSTSFTPLQIRSAGPLVAAVSTAGVNYTAEPTTLVTVKRWYISPTSGVIYQLPLGREVHGVVTASTAGKGWALRLTATGSTPNYAVNMEFEE